MQKLAFQEHKNNIRNNKFRSKKNKILTIILVIVVIIILEDGLRVPGNRTPLHTLHNKPRTKIPKSFFMNIF